jgi:hypothetical protein
MYVVRCERSTSLEVRNAEVLLEVLSDHSAREPEPLVAVDGWHDAGRKTSLLKMLSRDSAEWKSRELNVWDESAKNLIQLLSLHPVLLASQGENVYIFLKELRERFD